MNKIYNLDWLQFSAFIDPIEWDSMISKSIFKLIKCDYSTRHFRTIKEIWDIRQNKRIAVITYHPHSNALNKKLAIVKIDNWLLYQNYIINYLTDMITTLDIQFNNLSRIDICCDFNKIDYRNIHPAKFIKSFLSGYYVKLRKSKGQVYFEQGENLDFQYLKFGSGKSRVCSYIYNKTKELDQVTNKPHIRDVWKKYGLNGEIWRAEFRIQNFDFLLTDTDSGEQISFNGNISGLNSLDVINSIKPLFDAMSNHYLHFKIKDCKDSNKSRLKSFLLFDNDQQYLFNKTYNDNIESGRSEKIFIKKLYELNNELRGTDHELSIYGEEVLKKVINATELTEWAKHKQII